MTLDPRATLRGLAGRDPRIGILYPCSGTRDADFWAFAPPGASVHVTRLPFESRGTRGAVSAMSSRENLRAGAELLAGVMPSAVAWADTSGSFLFGPHGDAEQVQLLREVTGAYATTTSTAIAIACEALGVHEVDVASPYLPELNDALVEFLEAHGIRTARLRSLKLEDSYEIASVPDVEQAQLIRSASAGAPAVLVPCTDFFSVALIAPLENELDRLILAANPVTMWHAAAGLGGYPPGFGERLGRLFRAAPVSTRLQGS